MDPTNFRFKIHEISAIGAKCYLNVARSVPDMKIMEFCKVCHNDLAVLKK